MTNRSVLPDQVVAEDHRLERASSDSARALMELRWHWTLDESNPQRVGLREYARAVGRAHSTIHGYVHGFEYLRGRVDATTPDEALERAKLGTETEAAVEAVAEARELSFQYTRQDRYNEVRRVREIARDLAEQRGTSVAEEAPRVAQSLVREEEATRQDEEARRERRTLRYVEVEGELARAMRHLQLAAKAMDRVGFDGEERMLITHSIDSLRRLLDFLDHALTGMSPTQWEAEFRVLEGGA